MLRIRGNIRNRKLTIRRQKLRGVVKVPPHQRCGESPTPRRNDLGSRDFLTFCCPNDQDKTALRLRALSDNRSHRLSGKVVSVSETLFHSMRSIFQFHRTLFIFSLHAYTLHKKY
jgi:hypothetical protein